MSDYVTKTNLLSALGRFKENTDDLYATDAELTDVKNALQVESTMPSWEVGSLNGATGGNYSQSSRLRSTLSFGKNTGEISVRSVNGYEFLVFEWTSDGTYVGAYRTDDTFSKTSPPDFKWVTSFVFDATHRYKIVLRDANDHNKDLNISDAQNCLFLCNTDRDLSTRGKSADASIVGQKITKNTENIDNVAINYIYGNNLIGEIVLEGSSLIDVTGNNVQRYGYSFSGLSGKVRISYTEKTSILLGDQLCYKLVESGVYGSYHNIENSILIDIPSGSTLLVYNGSANQTTIESAFEGVSVQKAIGGCYIARNVDELLTAIRMAKYGETIKVMDGEYVVDSPVVISYGVSVSMGQYAKIVASSSFNGDYVLKYSGVGDFRYNTTNPITGGEDDYMCIRFSGGIIDANGLCGCFTIGNGMHITIENMTFLNPLTEGLYVGGLGFLYETIVKNCYARTFVSGCEGNIGFRINAMDNHFVDCFTQDVTTGFKLQQGANRFERCHIWGGRLGYPDTHPMLDDSIGFEVGGNLNTFMDCYADSSEIGFKIDGDKNIFNSCHFYNNYPKYGLDNVTFVDLNGDDSVFIGCVMESGGTPNLTKINNPLSKTYTKIGCIGFPV